MGIVKLGPDLYTGTDAYSGYLSTGNFTGFTMLHESGTGGAPKYGVVSQMPVVGKIENPLSDAINDTRAKPDVSAVGYYKASLGSGTVLEMTASNKAGLYKYNFPKTNQTNNVLVDVSHVLASYRGQGLEQHFLGGNITVQQDGNDKYSYTGSGTYDNVRTRALDLGTKLTPLGMESCWTMDRLLLWSIRHSFNVQDLHRSGRCVRHPC